MSGSFLTQRLAPAVPKLGILLISKKPKRKPTYGAQKKYQEGKQNDEDLPATNFPTAKKRRRNQPRRIKANGFSKIHTQAKQHCAGQHQPNALLLHSTVMDNQSNAEQEHRRDIRHNLPTVEHKHRGENEEQRC